MPTVLPSSIASQDHLRVFDEVAEERFSNLDTGIVITFLMNYLDVDAVGTMGYDLGVSGVGGLAQAATEQERRDVLSNSIRTRKIIGTPAAIKNAVQTLGFSEPEIIEGYGYPSSVAWAQFVVVLPEIELIGLTTDEVNELVDYINHYKNARSKLWGIGYYDPQTPTYNGVINHGGAYNHSGNSANVIIFVT